MLSFYVWYSPWYSPSALFFSGKHDKTIGFAGAAGLINRKCLQSTTISHGDADASETKKDTIGLISPAPVQA